MNYTGKFLILGLNCGGLLLYDVSNSFKEPTLISMDLLNLGSSNIYMDSIWWSLDGCSHLLGLYNTGTVSSFLNCGAPPNYEKLRRIKKEGNPFVTSKKIK